MPAALRNRLPALIAAAVAIEFFVELAVLVPDGTAHRGIAAVLLVAIAGGLALGPSQPLAGVTLVFGGMAAICSLSPEYYTDLSLPFAAPFFVSFWLGRRADRAEMIAGIVIGATLGLLTIVPQDHPDSTFAQAAANVAVLLGAPVLVGRLLRGRAALNRALREKAALLDRRRADAAGRAVIDERTRIAGELHDVVAHALSAMTVQATGARRLTLTRPALARDAFAAIESAGREALDELRRLLGVLRREDAELTLAPQPSLRHARSLARRVTAAGLPVSLRVEGEERELPVGLDVTAYRVIQDALGAALEHGGAGRAEVRLRFAPDTLEILVRDDGPVNEARPLTGIRERVVLHGGRLSATPRRSGGHAVRATLPLDGRTVPEPPADEPSCIAARTESVLRKRPWQWLRRHEITDALIAAAFAVAGLVELILNPDRSGPLVVNAAVVLGYTLPLLWRRRAPLAATAVVVASIFTMTLALTPVEDLFVPFVSMLACAYACGAHRDGPKAAAGLVLATVSMLAVVTTMDDRIVGDYVFPPLLAAVAWLAGRAVRTRTRLTEQLHETAARLAEATEDERRLAAIDERRRIAREMHDLVAHSMSVMVVQAGGARRILDSDPARALEAATMIERTGREALAEMRHLLGVLNLPAARAPQPTLAELDELVARSRAAGLPTMLELRGERRPLPAGLDLAAYRIVQEALTNAFKHAGRAPTTVTVEFGEDELALEVRDEGTGSANSDGGHGLVGMRERVRLYGGEIETGPAEGGGWRVRATLPIGEVALT
ncbi:MAG TPA: histidine kinase [Solirubrobacter sp.]|jgi:signal transduction histidine kinase|nr:histidine kinase [Solirubrobacter sp.]